MLRLDVLQSQWLILALVGGSALVLVFVLAYLAAWRAREPGRGGGGEGDAADAARRCAGHGPIPWVLVVLAAALAIYMVVYVFMAAGNPPNV
jgi:hypothetical protein